MTRKKSDAEEPIAHVTEACDHHDDAAAAERAFAKGVMARGEAAKPVDGELPPGATHEIVDDGPEGAAPTIRRTRFKAY